jgi:ABC-2 type transport system ATP-binding protein
MTSPPAIAVDRVSLTYGRGRRRITAVDDVSISIDGATLVAVLGPNGSGKSSLLLMMATALPPASGTISIGGETSLIARRRSTGVVFQSPALDPSMRVCEDLMDHAALRGIARSQRIALITRLLEEGGLSSEANTPIRHLSGGLKRRVDLCRAVLHDPPLLLLDEATTGLDPAARLHFLANLRQRVDDHSTTVIMTTHLEDEADAADRVIMMHKGKIVADAPPAHLRSQVGTTWVTTTARTAAPPTTDHTWRRVGDRWVIEAANLPPEVIEEMTAQGMSITIGPPSIADVFAEKTGVTLHHRERTS